MVEEMPEPLRYNEEIEEKIHDAGLYTLYRLNQMLENGYRVQNKHVRYGDSPSLAYSSIELEHPRTRTAFLRSDGSVNVHDGQKYFNIDRWDDDKFNTFLRKIP